MRIKLNITIILLLISVTFIYGQAPKYSNEFLSIGVGAKALGMSNATVANVNDVTSAYWNPSGLVLIPNDLQIGLMHAEYFAGIAKYDYAGGAFKINDSSSIGFSIIRFGVDNIPNTLELVDKDGNLRYDRISSFSVADYCFLVSYAKKANIEGLRYGANVKIIRRTAGTFASAWGFGLDASMQYDYKKWKFGVLARDVTSTFNAWQFNTSELEEVFILTGNEIPTNSIEMTMPKVIIGGAYNFEIYKKFAGMVEIDADVTTDGKRNVLVKSDPVSVDPHLGLEFNYNKLVFIRAGVGNIQEIPNIDGVKELSFQPNIGIGLRFKNFEIDYALANVGNQSIGLYSNIFSLRYSIDKK